MAISRFPRQAKRPYGFCVKMIAVGVTGLCFIFIWSIFSSSSPSTSFTSQRESFSDIAEPISANTKPSEFGKASSDKNETQKHQGSKDRSTEMKTLDESVFVNEQQKKKKEREARNEENSQLPKGVTGKEKNAEKEKEDEKEAEEEVVLDEKEEDSLDSEEEAIDEIEVNEEPKEEVKDEKVAGKKKKEKTPLFVSKANYNWKLCNTRSKHNYIPCIDNEGAIGRLQGYRHRERTCPKNPPMCLAPLPRDGYGFPMRWPDSKLKILYKNVAHPKLSAFLKTQSWVVESGEYLTFPLNRSEFKGGVLHYLECIEEMVPDIEWGKNIRLVLDIGAKDSSFGASLSDKDVLTLSLGLNNDLIDLAQVAIERGFPTIVSPLANRRLPFPSGVLDAIHCESCGINWHSNEGKLLLEMNRILRPGGYFILSSKHDNIEEEEAMTTLAASICWNVLAHKTDEDSELGIKIYQKPDSNDIYELRRKKVPPLCKEDENPDAAWYVPMKTCLQSVPSSIEEHGSEWPEEWPKRLETFPDWVNNKEKLSSDTEHWKAIVDKSYLTGFGIDWSNIRNIMDMKAIYGGFAAALSQQKVWVMNVVPVNAPNTLPIIYDRGLIGIYHDWCESFGTYPRSYDLLHVDHLFSRLKNRCRHPVAIIVEMDRILRPNGWAIIRDKVEILDPLEGILRSLHWEIRMTFAQDREGLICAQKTLWRP